jgi:hypothetical protein
MAGFPTSGLPEGKVAAKGQVVSILVILGKRSAAEERFLFFYPCNPGRQFPSGAVMRQCVKLVRAAEAFVLRRPVDT